MTQSNTSNTNKLTHLYLDVDDVILNTSETIISLLNQRYSLSKSLSDLRDWEYRSIYPHITTQELSSLFESDLFWSLVQIRPEFLTLLNSGALSAYDIHLTTHCSPETLPRKESLLTSLFSTHNFDFVPVLLPSSKSTIDMSDGIQVDDNLSNLIPTNASLKLLLTNSLSTTYNGQLNGGFTNIENLHVLNTLPDLQSYLSFISANPEEQL